MFVNYDKVLTVKRSHGDKPLIMQRDNDHTPYNKRSGEVKSACTVELEYYDGTKSNPDQWLRIQLEEVTQHEKTTATRTISTTLEPDTIKELQKMVCKDLIEAVKDVFLNATMTDEMRERLKVPLHKIIG